MVVCREESFSIWNVLIIKVVILYVYSYNNLGKLYVSVSLSLRLYRFLKKYIYKKCLNVI